MKDIKQLLIYVVLTVGVILLLVNISNKDSIPSSVVVGLAVFFVVVLPVIVAVRLSKKERERQQQ